MVDDGRGQNTYVIPEILPSQSNLAESKKFLGL